MPDTVGLLHNERKILREVVHTETQYNKLLSFLLKVPLYLVELPSLSSQLFYTVKLLLSYRSATLPYPCLYRYVGFIRCWWWGVRAVR